jgi:hypothetical protein
MEDTAPEVQQLAEAIAELCKYAIKPHQERNDRLASVNERLVALCEEVLDDLRQVVETEFGIGAAEQDVAKWRERLAALNGGTR